MEVVGLCKICECVYVHFCGLVIEYADVFVCGVFFSTSNLILQFCDKINPVFVCLYCRNNHTFHFVNMAHLKPVGIELTVEKNVHDKKERVVRGTLNMHNVNVNINFVIETWNSRIS